jgi:hypothetical protein
MIEPTDGTLTKLQRKTPAGVRKVPGPAPPPSAAHTKAASRAAIASSSTSTSSKRRRISPSPTQSSRDAPPPDLPQNLTHTAQSALPASVLASEPITLAEEAGEAEGWPGYPGMSDDEVFRMVSRPQEILGVDDWGIPGEVDPVECGEALKVSYRSVRGWQRDLTVQTKVDSFLRLKHERGEHINTRLLSSSAFANPYIYSKLVHRIPGNTQSHPLVMYADSVGGLCPNLRTRISIPIFRLADSAKYRSRNTNLWSGRSGYAAKSETGRYA